MNNLDLKFIKMDEGYSRAYYNNKGTKDLYCLQDDGSWGRFEAVLYACSKDGEPSQAIPWERVTALDKCPEDTKLGKQFNEYIASIPREVKA